MNKDDPFFNVNISVNIETDDPFFNVEKTPTTNVNVNYYISDDEKRKEKALEALKKKNEEKAMLLTQVEALHPIYEKIFWRYVETMGFCFDEKYVNSHLYYFPARLWYYLQLIAARGLTVDEAKEFIHLKDTTDGQLFFNGTQEDWEKWFNRPVKFNYSDMKKKWSGPRWFGDNPYPELEKDEPHPLVIQQQVKEKLLDAFMKMTFNKGE